MTQFTPQPTAHPEAAILSLSPVPALVNRLCTEMSHAFKPDRPIRISRAPGRLDVMGGIGDYTGSMVCEATLDRAAAVAIQARDDRNVQIFSFNLLDEGLPFTVQIPLQSLTDFAAPTLRSEFTQSGRRWAAHLAGCLFVLDENDLISLADPKVRGLNIAVCSTVPMQCGLGSSAAIQVGAMVNLVHHFGLESRISGAQIAGMCRQVEEKIVGAPAGVMGQMCSAVGEDGALLRMICQPVELLPSLRLPDGIRLLGINSNIKNSAGAGMFNRTRCSTFMGHKIILEKMREMGRRQGKELAADPMKGYLANLDPDDYKALFRAALPEYMKGEDFLDQYGSTVDASTKVNPKEYYHVQKSTDHHVLEARRVRRFVDFLEQAQSQPAAKRRDLLNKAGHLMYASHLSYANDALLSVDECDRLVQLVRDREAAGLYGARITGAGSGGTVAVLAEVGSKADQAIGEIMEIYAKETGRRAETIPSGSPGAVHAGTAVIC